MNVIIDMGLRCMQAQWDVTILRHGLTIVRHDISWLFKLSAVDQLNKPVQREFRK